MDMKQASQVLDLLEFFMRGGQPATLAEISKQLGWPKSSTFKLLGALSGRGYLYEPYGRGQYYPSPRWSAVVDVITRSEPVPKSLKGLLHSLADQTGETAVLASMSGVNALFVEVVEPENPVRYTAEVGKTVPVHVTAIGRALLAQLSDQERSAILGRVMYKKFTSESLVSQREVELEVARGVRKGYFEGKGELNRDLGGVALPLNVPGRPMAIMVAGPLYRVGSRYAEIALLVARELQDVESSVAEEAAEGHPSHS